MCYPILSQPPELFVCLFLISSFNFFSKILITIKARTTDSSLGPFSPSCIHFLNKTFILLFFGTIYSCNDLLKRKRNYRNHSFTYHFVLRFTQFCFFSLLLSLWQICILCFPSFHFILALPRLYFYTFCFHEELHGFLDNPTTTTQLQLVWPKLDYPQSTPHLLTLNASLTTFFSLKIYIRNYLPLIYIQFLSEDRQPNFDTCHVVLTRQFPYPWQISSSVHQLLS